MQLAGRLLAEDPSALPHVLDVGRDRAHAVRTNLRAPLKSDAEVSRIRHELFDKKDSLSKLLQYHPRARNVHIVCQQAVLRQDGEQGGGLKTILRNFSFANQRFESEGSPARRIATTLMASLLFLTSEVDDTNRKKAERDNAAEILTVFNPEDMTLFGLESDLASHGVEFLRSFDVHLQIIRRALAGSGFAAAALASVRAGDDAPLHRRQNPSQVEHGNHHRDHPPDVGQKEGDLLLEGHCPDALPGE